MLPGMYERRYELHSEVLSLGCKQYCVRHLTFILCLQPPSGTSPWAKRSHISEKPDTSTTITAASSS